MYRTEGEKIFQRVDVSIGGGHKKKTLQCVGEGYMRNFAKKTIKKN